MATSKTPAYRYHKILVEFMSYLHDEEYEADHAFTEEELAVIQPEDIRNWMNFKAYGVPEPAEEDKPIKGRANSLQFYKKALSSFFTKCPWNDIARLGNPTRSPAVHQAIAAVKKAEDEHLGRKQGRPRLSAKDLDQTLESADRIDDDKMPRAVYSHCVALRKEVHALREEIRQSSGEADRQFTVMNRHLKRIAYQQKLDLQRRKRSRKEETAGIALHQTPLELAGQQQLPTQTVNQQTPQSTVQQATPTAHQQPTSTANHRPNSSVATVIVGHSKNPISESTGRANPVAASDVANLSNMPRTPAVNTAAVVELIRNPKSLEELWEEYEFGIGGRKPARTFTPEERGSVKCTYCRRKVFWDTIDALVQEGWSPATAIDKVLHVYGRQLPVTGIIDAMRSDRKKNKNLILQKVRSANHVHDPTSGVAELSDCPRSLHALWFEYTDGIGDRKAARLFNPKERGACKYKYSRRKIFWKAVELMMQSGMTSDAAIERIHEIYGKGKGTVTNIIDLMRKDKIEGKRPELFPTKAPPEENPKEKV